MAVENKATTGGWKKEAVMTRSTVSISREARPSSRQESVVETLNRILGYDLQEATLMAEGYREMGNEGRAIAESNIAASAETLPEE